MGCCQAKIEIGEVLLPAFDHLEIDSRVLKTDEGFSDVSLDSHQEENYHIMETSKTRLGDSMLYNTRSTSISLHRTDLEVAFLQTSGIIRRNTLDFFKEKRAIYEDR